jgi:predicted phage-related endonuclease
VVAAKLFPKDLDPVSMGRMLSGRALENEVVQLIRIALKGQLRDTGRKQLEVRHPELPFRAHPDGRIIGNEDDALLEVKTASSSVFKRYQNEGLPSHYEDQVQAQLGLSGLQRCLLVLVSRENLAELTSFNIAYDPMRFEELVNRARIAAGALNIGSLPDGEPERGFCHSCQYANECPQFQAQRKGGERGEIPEIMRLQVEAQLEELSGIESELTPMQERVSELRDQIKSALLCTGASKITLENGIVQIVDSTRTSFDSKTLQKEAPELYSRFLKTSLYSNIRITTRKGDRKCLSKAS